MADYGYRLTRDACGKHSVPATIARAWDIDELRKKMNSMTADEVKQLAEKNIEAFIIKDEDRDIIEIRENTENRLISYYEIEEFTQC